MMKLTIEKPIRASRPAPESAAKILPLSLLSLAEAARVAEEDAAMDAEGILAQAEEANALDPVG